MTSFSYTGLAPDGHVAEVEVSGSNARRWIAHPEWDRLAAMDGLSGGPVKLVNLAPDAPGGPDFIEWALAAGKKIVPAHFGKWAAAQIRRFDNMFRTFLDCGGLILCLIWDGCIVEARWYVGLVIEWAVHGGLEESVAPGSGGAPPSCAWRFSVQRRLSRLRGLEG